MNTKVLYRRAGMVGTLIAGLLAGLVILGGTAYAPPQGGAPVNIRDVANPENSADVTADGELKVTGNVSVSGTADVNVVNTPLEVSGEVDIGNFPDTQDVNVVNDTVQTSVTTATETGTEGFLLASGELEDRSIPAIDASLITVTEAGDDEVEIQFFGGDPDDPLSPTFQIGDTNENLGPLVTIPLTQPFHVEAIGVFCGNESEDCEVQVHLVGS